MVTIAHLEALLQETSGQRQPAPLEKWNPPYCGLMPLKIDESGQWWHAGSRIRREKMIDLFARVLWREEDRYFLKTPVEKVEIEVEDVPLLVTHLEDRTLEGKTYLILKTMQGDNVLVGPDHVPFMRMYAGQARPYVRVRRNLEALINRNTFYHLLALGEIFEQSGQTGVRLASGDFTFALVTPEIF